MDTSRNSDDFDDEFDDAVVPAEVGEDDEYHRYTAEGRALTRRLLDAAVRRKTKEDGRPFDPETHAATVLAVWKQQQAAGKAAAKAVESSMGAALDGALGLRQDGVKPGIVIPASVIVFGDKTCEGQLVDAVSVAWFEILEQLARDPDYLYRVHWRTMEEVIAGAYEREGFQVVLTPRSGDKGRDVIASKEGIGAIRIIDQVKAIGPGQRVEPDDVRAMMGVLQRDANVSKAVITTTTIFAPSISEEWRHYIPYRLELKPGPVLREWLASLHGRQRSISRVRKNPESIEGACHS